MQLNLRKNLLLAGGCILLSASPAQAAVFDIHLNFTSGLSTDYQSYFTNAANFWKSIITGYDFDIGGNLLNSGITIDLSGSAGAVGGTLATAGVSYIQHSNLTSGRAVVNGGSINIDTVDLPNMIANNTFQSVIEHEMAHVLGFGTLWEANQVYTDGTGQYTGSFGLEAYRAEFGQPAAAFVPVELEGGAGTADGHWDEVDDGFGVTGITDSQGRDMRYELMTGWLNGPTFLSNTTIQSFRDLGYTVAAVPLPGAVWLFGSALLSLMGLSAKKRRVGIV